MLRRREFFIGAAALAGLAGTAAPSSVRALEVNEDGLHVQPFFIQSFLVLREDLEAAHQAGKRLAVMFELKGCPYCKETHLVNFADPAIRGLITEKFDFVQLNLIGDKTVTDFDGEELSEKELASKWGVRFTPTIVFFPESSAEIGKVGGKQAEVARMPGYFKPPHFLAMLRYVERKAYKTQRFDAFLKAQPAG